ncbi:hypothetical protein [Cryobacterium sp. TMT4-31]|uniref:hypothetical protein n=1 Tax=Cryobacterium sp. TMT4-31 TaxID=1259259 RepID=UPI00106CC4BA|nr:hypothetical protein [Cryobacterium sp. TMT4-31]TFC84963.1 hypothetical protein E3T19_18610 [Cryobacterium sp. TMT4-31]
MNLDAYPTRVMLMAEYCAGLPLWDRSPSPDAWGGPLPRGVLGLSDDLENRLVGWNSRYELLMGQNQQEWPSPAEHLAFVVDGHLLAAELQQEFGSAVVVLYLDADAERSRAPQTSRASQTATPPAAAWHAVGGDGQTFSPAPPRSSIVEQMWAMPDAEFRAMTRTVDVAAWVWTPGRTPTRILLEPRDGGLPLRNRSPLLDLVDDRLEPAVLGLSGPLVGRLADWNERWIAVTEPTLGYLIDGHDLAAAVQTEVGPEIQVLFPEADRATSQPSNEMRQMLHRVQALRAADGSE